MNHNQSPDHNRLSSRILSETFPELQSGELLQNIFDSDHQLLRKILSIPPLIIWAVDRHGIVTLSEGGGLNRLGFLPGE